MGSSARCNEAARRRGDGRPSSLLPTPLRPRPVVQVGGTPPQPAADRPPVPCTPSFPLARARCARGSPAGFAHLSRHTRLLSLAGSLSRERGAPECRAQVPFHRVPGIPTRNFALAEFTTLAAPILHGFIPTGEIGNLLKLMKRSAIDLILLRDSLALTPSPWEPTFLPDDR